VHRVEKSFAIFRRKFEWIGHLDPDFADAIVRSDPIGTLAHLQLGRAFVLSGDKLKAKAAYQDFLALWKDADSDIPIFKQAKAEAAISPPAKISRA
jgi:hypothetical protein